MMGLNLEAPTGRGRQGLQADRIHTPGDLQAPKCNILGSIGPCDQALPWIERLFLPLVMLKDPYDPLPTIPPASPGWPFTSIILTLWT